MTSQLNTSDIDLIELSGKWVYRHPDKGERLKVNGNNYVVKAGEYNKSSGLDYMIVENATTGEISMVFEGTQGTQDFLTDGTLPGSIPNTQLREADAAYKKEVKNIILNNYVASNKDNIAIILF
ncbi:hypothetical protein AB346_13010 [Listeria innocua]|nr:hypothetical protein [Listeria innocua]EAF5658077.1 hypothetical protein [Listeria innocua]MBC1378087.1 hypothetical protein [Listeria innocua]UPH51617.1 hypothetical protein EWI69_13640 [Listeria innocua]UPH62582.1 hypothetical protein AB346_13010 [Listeria innocua]